MRMEIEHIYASDGKLIGIFEKLDDRTTVYEPCGYGLGFSNPTGTYRADGEQISQTDLPALLLHLRTR